MAILQLAIVSKLPYLFAYKPSDFCNKLTENRSNLPKIEGSAYSRVFSSKKITGAEQDLKFNVSLAISRAIINKQKFPTSQ